jgi:hypothetical protein
MFLESTVRPLRKVDVTEWAKTVHALDHVSTVVVLNAF